MLRSVLALALLAVPPQDPPKADYSVKNLEALAAECAKLVEEACGKGFAVPPRIRVSTEEEVRALLATELKPQMKNLMPEATDAEREGAARTQAALLASTFLGKYAPGDRTLHFLPGNFEKMAGLFKDPEISGPGFLRIVVIHELVHALDDQEFKIFARLPALGSPEEAEAYNACIEGHAQHVTAKVAGPALKDAFGRFEDLIVKPLPGMDEGQKLQAQIATASFRFSYLDGKRFFDAVAAELKGEAAAKVFANPPKTKAEILLPRRWLAPGEKAKALDVAPALDAFVALAGKPEWMTRQAAYDPAILRADFGDFLPADVVGALVPRHVAGRFVLCAKNPNFMTVMKAVQMDGAEGAAKVLEAVLAMNKAKDERLKGEGSIRITESAYGELEAGGGKWTTVKRVMKAGGEAIPTLNVVGTSGALFVELVWVGEPPADLGKAVLAEVLGKLKDGK